MNLYTVRQQLNMGVALSSMQLRVTYYSRVSTEHLEQQSSLKNQIDYFEEMIKSNSNWTYISGYVDDGISGTTDYKRGRFMQMIEDAQNNKFDLIVTKEISRFSRNTLDSIKYTRDLLSYGVAVLFVNDNINTALSDSELRLTIMASMAQDEIRRLSERVRFGMKRTIKNGTILGNNMLYGYKKDKLSGNLYIISREASVVERMYNMYAIDKISLSKIVKIFNNEGIKTRQNKKWCVSTITRMLNNPKYKGFYRGHTTEIVDYMTKKVRYIPKNEQIIYEDSVRIPPIVSSELWESANIRLKSRNKKCVGKFKNNKMLYQNRYPLSCKIYCSKCDEVFHRRVQLKSSNDVTWCCATYYKKGKKACNSPNLRESEIYNIFYDAIKYLGIEISNVSKILIDLYQNSQKKINCDNKLMELNKQKNKIILKKDKLLELNIEGNLSNNEFSIKNNEYNNEIKRINEEIAKIEKAKINFESFKDMKLKEILSKKIIDSSIITKMIDLLLHKIVVSKINGEEYSYELKISFNFSEHFIEQELHHKIISNVNSFKTFYIKKFKFQRGINSKSTKKYNVYYYVNYGI